MVSGVLLLELQEIFNSRKQSLTIFTLSPHFSSAFYIRAFTPFELSAPITITHYPGPGGMPIIKLSYYFKPIGKVRCKSFSGINGARFYLTFRYSYWGLARHHSGNGATHINCETFLVAIFNSRATFKAGSVFSRGK